jgi:2-(1,2-epoxy-1,2-dihydrophenyl)acetyl-CoA isomerase
MAEWWPSGRSWAADWRRSWSDLLSASSAMAASLGLPASGVLPGDPFGVVMDAARAWLVGQPRTFRLSGRDLTLTLTDIAVEGSDMARAVGQYGQVRIGAQDVQWDGHQFDRLEILARNVHLRPGRQPTLVAAPLLVEAFVPAPVASRWLAAALPRLEVTWRDGLPQLNLARAPWARLEVEAGAEGRAFLIRPRTLILRGRRVSLRSPALRLAWPAPRPPAHRGRACGGRFRGPRPAGRVAAVAVPRRHRAVAGRDARGTSAVLNPAHDISAGVPDFDVDVRVGGDHVAVLEFARGAHNILDSALASAIADACDSVAAEGRARSVLLCSAGKHFCAGADFSGDEGDFFAPSTVSDHPYDSIVRLLAQPLPMVIAVQGGAIGGGLGLALVGDFRFGSEQTRFSAPFARLGMHQGSAITVTLPWVTGRRHASDLMLTGRRVRGEEALQVGLLDRLVPADQLREAAHAYAAGIAAGAPVTLRTIRASLRADLVDRARAVIVEEEAEQARPRPMADHADGIAADLARRPPVFHGR